MTSLQASLTALIAKLRSWAEEIEDRSAGTATIKEMRAEADELATLVPSLTPEVPEPEKAQLMAEAESWIAAANDPTSWHGHSEIPVGLVERLKNALGTAPADAAALRAIMDKLGADPDWVDADKLVAAFIDEQERLRAALRAYGQHKPGCGCFGASASGVAGERMGHPKDERFASSVSHASEMHCTCGLTALQAGAALRETGPAAVIHVKLKIMAGADKHVVAEQVAEDIRSTIRFSKRLVGGMQVEVVGTGQPDDKKKG